MREAGSRLTVRPAREGNVRGGDRALGSGAPGLGPGLFADPEGVTFHDGAYYISDSDNNRVVRYIVVTN